MARVYPLENQGLKDFFKVQTPDEVTEKLGCFRCLSKESVCLEKSHHRVLGEDIVSETDLPEFPRSTVDGYALKAKDTYGASEKNPAFVRVTGEIRMGQVSDLEVRDGEAVKVATGGMVPRGADAVEMVEDTDLVDQQTIQIYRTLSPLENVIRKGEDVRAGEVVLRRGFPIRPQDAGLLASIGITEVPVFQRPRVGILSSGDEIIPVDQQPRPGQIRDINRYTISSMTDEAGGIPVFLGIAGDRFEEIQGKIDQGIRELDMIAITGGSSVGVLDLTLDVLKSFSGSKLLTHGISVRPGKPTLIAEVNGKPFLGLPGHPVSALVIFHLFGIPLLKILAGWPHNEALRRRKVWAKTSRNIPSTAGREDYVRVRLEEKEGTLWAHPLFGKSGAMAHLVQADGLLKIGLHVEGLEQGETAEVFLI